MQILALECLPALAAKFGIRDNRDEPVPRISRWSKNPAVKGQPGFGSIEAEINNETVSHLFMHASVKIINGFVGQIINEPDLISCQPTVSIGYRAANSRAPTDLKYRPA